jgi:DNA polymerase
VFDPFPVPQGGSRGIELNRVLPPHARGIVSSLLLTARPIAAILWIMTASNITNIIRTKALQELAAEIERCSECRKGGIGLAVPGEGTAGIPVMFIGEAPGKQESRTGRPFVGRSGQLLRATLAGIGIEPERAFITSPVHYLPERGKPSPAMIAHGATHLLKQIAVIKPRLLVLLGNSACRAVLGRNIEIAKDHGTVVEKDGIACLISFHPAYAMRFPEGRKKFIRDFGKLKALLAKP